MQQMMANTNNTYTAIYCRLSQEDGNLGDSQSIQNQKSFLRNYVLDKGWKIYDIYVDDGYSGTNFDRPGFKQMISDIECGRINIVVTKDLSRLGRNYIETGRYTEQFFPDHNVRYIAVNDNVDTFKEDNDFAPFKNIINEYYSKDQSKKVRYVLNNNMKNGKPAKTAVLLYGYLYDNDSKRIPDPQTAPIVKYIFKRFLETQSTSLIAKELVEQKVYLPLYYNYLVTGYNEEKYSNPTEKEKYGWTRQAVYKILKKREYKGDYIRGKVKTRFKSKVRRKATEDELFIFENKYEALVSEEDFLKVQELLKSNVNINSSTSFNPYRGILKCGICGHSLRIAYDKNTGKTRVYCRQKEGNESPTIDLEVLNQLVLQDINDLQKYILSNETEFLLRVQNYIDTQPYQKVVSQKKLALDKLKSELEKYQIEERNVFEDYHKGLLNRETYLQLLESYSSSIESTKKKIRIAELEFQNDVYEKQDYYSEAKTFIRLLKEFNFDLNSDSSYLSQIYSSITIKCEPNILKYKQRPVIIEFNIKGIDEIVKGYVDEKQNNQLYMCNIC